MSFLEEALLNPGAAPEVYPEDRRAAAEEGRAATAAATEESSAAAAAAAPIEMRAWGNTGPKGVLRDYRDAEARLAQRMEAKAAAARAQAVRNSFTVRSAREEDEDDDAEAFARYRAARIAELQQQKQKQQQQQWVRRLGTYDYMETVQGADPERFVVVHIFAPGVPACAALGRVLAALARRVGNAEGCVDFHDISLADALDAFDEDALPAVLVYRRGQPLHCHLRVAPAALERLLAADGVIDEPEQQPHRRGGDDDDEDEDDDESDRHSSSGDEDDD